MIFSPELNVDTRNKKQGSIGLAILSIILSVFLVVYDLLPNAVNRLSFAISFT